MSVRSALHAVVTGRVRPGLCPMCGPTVFHIRGAWLRDDYVCRRCHSIPRQRALVKVMATAVPDLATKRVLECAPGSPSSDWIRRHSGEYTPTQYFADVPRGEVGPGGARSEDLQALTLPDASYDVVVTQDVFEHIVDPDAAWREIARVLVPGGVHVWTVPIHAGSPTVVRAEPDARGGVRELAPAQYHGNPLGGGSLVVHDWGDDVVTRADRVAGTTTTRHVLASRVHGIAGHMRDVLVSRR